MSKKAFREDTMRSVGILESITGERIIGFRASEWSVWPETIWALDILVSTMSFLGEPIPATGGFSVSLSLFL